MARKGLPKKYAKMGFKKGWREFKKAKRAAKRKRKKSRSSKTRRRRGRVIKSRSRTMAKKRRRRSNRMSKRTKQLLGAAGYAVIGEPALDAVASRVGLGVSDDIVKGLAGFGLSFYTSGVPKAIGDAAVVIATYKVAGQRLGNIFGGLLGNKQAQSSENSGSQMVLVG